MPLVICLNLGFKETFSVLIRVRGLQAVMTKSNRWGWLAKTKM